MLPGNVPYHYTISTSTHPPRNTASKSIVFQSMAPELISWTYLRPVFYRRKASVYCTQTAFMEKIVHSVIQKRTNKAVLLCILLLLYWVGAQLLHKSPNIQSVICMSWLVLHYTYCTSSKARTLSKMHIPV